MLKVRGVFKSFSGKDGNVLESISLDILENEFFVLVGESGSGKTTLLRIVAGLEREDAGEVFLRGVCVSSPQSFTRPEKRRVGLVFQDYALFPHLSVRENVAFGLQGLPRGERAGRIDEVLRLVGLQGMHDRYPHQMSGGEQQRLALARALAPRPGLVLLDEPYSNQDALIKEQLRDEVRDIVKRAGASALLVTHDIRDALCTGDRIGVLRHGRLLQVGPPSEVYHRPSDEYTARLLGPVNLLSMEADDGVLRLGSFRLQAHGLDLGHGTVRIGVRPEHVALCSGNLPEGFTSARILRQRFLGAHRILHLQADSMPGVELQALVHTAAALPQDQCGFRIDAHNLIVLG